MKKKNDWNILLRDLHDRHFATYPQPNSTVFSYQTKSEVPSGHFKFKITGHFSGFNIDLIEFFRRIMPADHYAKSTRLSI
jgi:hypothetical protein